MSRCCLLLGIWLGVTAGLPAQELPLVLSTASMIDDIARNIGGANFVYDVIVPIGGDPHIYEPTPRDAHKCNEAALILRNGLTFEGWLNKLIENSGTRAEVVTVSKGVAAISSQQYTNATDPHAWMDASNGVIYAQNIRDAMIRLAPELEADLVASYERYKRAVEETDSYVMRQISSIPAEKRILITSHDAFQYFGRRYGIQLEAVLGTSTDADVQTSDIRRLNEVIRSTRVPAVFIESTINPRILQQIARDNGVVVGGKLYADSLGDSDTPAGTYLGMLRYNADVIFAGLSQERADAGDGHHSAVEEPSSITWLWGLLLAPIVLAVVVFLVRMVRR
ncbi:MAG: zinc ABC transporter substrate-binding protein [Saprospiraceae bacterium]|nr:zinc ABC transporter substrate-binding protein [Saprospiraceae bacterium]